MKKLNTTALAIWLGLTMALPAAAQNIAIVNGKALPVTRLQAIKNQLAQSGRPLPPEAEKELRQRLIDSEILTQEALRRGLDTTEAYRLQMELARQSILTRELLADFEKKNPVTDAAIKAEYDRFVATNGGKEYRARHILVEDEAQAKSLIAQIKAGAKFEDLAKSNSKDPGSGANGGDLDWANANSYVPEFSAAMTQLQKGQMTETPVKSQFGWHIIRVEDVREPQLPKLEELKPQIEQHLKQQRTVDFRQNILNKAKVE